MKKGIISAILMILVGIAIVFLSIALKKYDWYLRSWILYLTIWLITFGVIIFVISILKFIKINPIKNILIAIWILISLFICFVEFIFLAWFIKSDSVKEIDNNKYVGIEYFSNRLRKEVNYYEEYNIFAYHKTYEYIEEFYDYDDYVHPEYRKYYKIPQTDSIIYYYDENGEITKTRKYDENGAIVDINTNNE